MASRATGVFVSSCSHCQCVTEGRGGRCSAVRGGMTSCPEEEAGAGREQGGAGQGRLRQSEDKVEKGNLTPESINLLYCINETVSDIKVEMIGSLVSNFPHCGAGVQ